MKALDERTWSEAKARARVLRPELDEDSDRFYRLALGIYDRASGRGPMTKAAIRTWDRVVRATRLVLRTGGAR